MSQTPTIEKPDEVAKQPAVEVGFRPHPRFRIYSTRRTYATIARDILTWRRLRGDSCGELESAIQPLGVAHAVCTNQARQAIYLAIRALAPNGGKVLLSPYTIYDVVNMVIYAGGAPVFGDIERETCNIDPAEVERLAGECDVVMVTHLHGLACDMNRIREACRSHNVPLIEDAAQAFGTRWEGRHVGTLGDVGIYSFGMYKNINAFYGGMLTTQDAAVAESVRAQLEEMPRFGLLGYLKQTLRGVMTDTATFPPLFKLLTFPVFRYAFLNDVATLNRRVTEELNPSTEDQIPKQCLSRMSPMQARIVLQQIDQVDQHIEQRIQRAEMYRQGLQDIPELLLAPLRTDFSHTYSYFPIQFEERKTLLQHMMRNNRDVAAQHLRNCASLPCFEEFARDCPNAQLTADSVVLLPTYPRYSLRDVEANIVAIRQFFGKS